jgi:hypothetical protein
MSWALPLQLVADSKQKPGSGTTEPLRCLSLRYRRLIDYLCAQKPSLNALGQPGSRDRLAMPAALCGRHRQVRVRPLPNGWGS